MNHKTTILLDIQTREDLRNIGRKGQSYDSLIRELIFLAHKSEGIEPINEALPHTTNNYTNAAWRPNLSVDNEKKEFSELVAQENRTDRIEYIDYKKEHR